MDIQAFSSIYSTGNGAFLCAGIVFSLILVGFGIVVKSSGGGADFTLFLEVCLFAAIFSMFGSLAYGAFVDLPAKFHAQDAYMEEFKDTLADKDFTLVDGKLPFENYDVTTIKLEKDGVFSLCEVTDPKDSDTLSFECATLSDPVNLGTLLAK